MPPLVPQRRNGRPPLSFAQERLWFLDQLGLVGPAYNQTVGIRLSGELMEAALEKAFGELVRRHQSLRTRFEVQNGVPYQLVGPSANFKLHRENLSDVTDAQERDRQSRGYMRREALHQFSLSERSITARRVD